MQGLLLLLAFRAGHAPEEAEPEDMAASKSLVFTVLGLIMVIGGGAILVPMAEELASDWGVSEAVIGVSVIALEHLCLNWPTLAGLRRGETQLVLGNIVGSNISNIPIVFGATALLAPGSLGSWSDMQVYLPQLAVMAAATLVLVSYMIAGRHLCRRTGSMMILTYIGLIAGSLDFSWEYDVTLTFPKTALITGGAKRLGLAMAKRLAADGWHLAIHANQSATQGEEAIKELQDLGASSAHLILGDLMDENAMTQVYDQAAAAVGPLGVLINNASTFEYDEVATATKDSWDLHMLVNARAPFVLSQKVAAQGQSACIINMLDQRIFNWNHHFATYSVAKGALWTMTQTMAISLAPLKIRVNGIGPGPTLPSPRQNWDQFKVQQRYTLLDRLVKPEEIADTAHYLIHNPSVTGQMIAVDGGQHLNWAPPKAKDMELQERRPPRRYWRSQ